MHTLLRYLSLITVHGKIKAILSLSLAYSSYTTVNLLAQGKLQYIIVTQLMTGLGNNRPGKINSQFIITTHVVFQELLQNYHLPCDFNDIMCS